MYERNSIDTSLYQPPLDLICHLSIQKNMICVAFFVGIEGTKKYHMDMSRKKMNWLDVWVKYCEGFSNERSNSLW